MKRWTDLLAASLSLAFVTIFALVTLNGAAVLAQGDPTATPATEETMESADGTPLDDETPMDETPMEGTPLDETHMDETPMEDMPTDDMTPLDETPTETITPTATSESTATPVETLDVTATPDEMLTPTGTATPDSAPMLESAIETTLGDITGNSAAFYGDRVAIEGEVNDLLNVRILVLGQAALLGEEEVLVVNNSGQEFPLTLIQGERARIVGIVHPALNEAANAANAASDTDAMAETDDSAVVDATPSANETIPEGDMVGTPAVDAAPTNNLPDYFSTPAYFPAGVTAAMLDNYRNHTIVEVTALEGLGLAATLGELTGNTDVYAGQPLYVQGQVGELITSDSFILAEGALLGNDQVLVFNNTGAALPALEQGQNVRVYGWALPFDAATVANATGREIDDVVFADYADYTAFIVDSVNVIEDVTE